ncbi:hypothetical protein Taro_019818 [Colocasia esculenta]|uniref:Uncharacterized protein n=1 Tax=Colocasia esculenta TaxID=4460 RepID=A0A843V3C5_COLES|nr:hypothetical protein [Colocasia esculenta]
MASDSELVRRLQEFLRSSDLTTTTTAAVRRQLEEEFGVDLSGKKAFIREQVDLFLQNQFDDDGRGEEGHQGGGAQDEENGGVKEEDDEGGGEEGEGDGEEEEDDDEAEEGTSNGKGGGTKGYSSKERPYLHFMVVKQLWVHIHEQGLDKAYLAFVFKRCCHAYFVISIAGQVSLVTFLSGTPDSQAESALSRADVVKRMWHYIKENKLQDPTDKRQIICDEKLKELFSVDTFHGFTVPKLLAPHFVKAEH